MDLLGGLMFSDKYLCGATWEEATIISRYPAISGDLEAYKSEMKSFLGVEIPLCLLESWHFYHTASIQTRSVLYKDEFLCQKAKNLYDENLLASEDHDKGKTDCDPELPQNCKIKSCSKNSERTKLQIRQNREIYPYYSVIERVVRDLGQEKADLLQRLIDVNNQLSYAERHLVHDSRQVCKDLLLVVQSALKLEIDNTLLQTHENHS